jgi:hypothetical protein
MFGKDYAGNMVRERQAKQAVGAFIVVWLGVILINVLIWGGLIWAAIHFARKYW